MKKSLAGGVLPADSQKWPGMFLTTDDIITLHDRIIRESGGVSGMNPKLKKECQPGRPHAVFGRVASLLDVRDQAREYARAIRENRPFFDGNKRTAEAASALFRTWNGGAHA